MDLYNFSSLYTVTKSLILICSEFSNPQPYPILILEQIYSRTRARISGSPVQQTEIPGQFRTRARISGQPVQQKKIPGQFRTRGRGYQGSLYSRRRSQVSLEPGRGYQGSLYSRRRSQDNLELGGEDIRVACIVYRLPCGEDMPGSRVAVVCFYIKQKFDQVKLYRPLEDILKN